MKKFVSNLENLDYFLFVRPYSSHYSPLDMAAMRLTLPSRLRVLVDVFSLRQEIEADELAKIIGVPVLERLVAAEILIPCKSKIRARCILGEIRGHPYFYDPLPDSIAYFAEDSLALERYSQKVPCESALDLCAGPGLQALSLSERAQHVTAVEVDAVAYKILLVNISMNKNSEKITAVNMSVSDFVCSTSDQFEQIVCNPPFLPLPNDLLYSKHGGEDGLRIIRTVLENVPKICTLNGVIEVVGASLYRKLDLEVSSFLEEICGENGLGMTLLEMCRYPWRTNSLFFQNLVANAIYQSPEEGSSIGSKLKRFMEKRDADGLAMFFSKFKRKLNTEIQVNRIDFSAVSPSGWFF